MSKENLLFEDGLNRFSCLEKRHLNGNKIQNVKLQMVRKKCMENSHIHFA